MEFGRDAVVAVGKLARYNDARTHLLVELRDGRRAFVKAIEQDPADARWLLAPHRSLRAFLSPHTPYAEFWRRLDQMIGLVASRERILLPRETVLFRRPDVVRVGRRRTRRTARAALLVELGDGRQAFVAPSEQSIDDQAWLSSRAPELARGEAEKWSPAWATEGAP